MGQTQSSYPPFPDYEAAGVLFIDEKHVLAGYQPKKRRGPPSVTGIGGAKEDEDATYVDTAFRELFEELLGWEKVPATFVTKVAGTVKPSAVFQNESYVTIALSFEELPRVLRMAKAHSSRSPFYESFPLTAWDLIRNRRVLADAEVQELVLLPLLSGSSKLSMTIHRELQEDVKQFLGATKG